MTVRLAALLGPRPLHASSRACPPLQKTSPGVAAENTFTLTRDSCKNFWTSLRDGSFLWCLQPRHVQAVPGGRASVRLDGGIVCGRLFENHRGGDAFVDFTEAAALDARAAQLAGDGCSWPPPLRLSS